jgi:hypothetical protein
MDNGSGDSTMIVLLLGGVMMMCLSSCCSSIMTAYANECDTDGTFSALAGDWYWNIVPSSGLMGCTTSDITVTTTDDSSGGDGDTNTGGSGGGGGSGSGCSPGDTSKNTYKKRIEKDGKWTCESGYEDTGCTWGDREHEERQCRKLKSGEKDDKKSKCNVGTEANYDYRERRKTSSGRWECPEGWSDTKCGLVTNADGKWVDGDDKGKKQCRKRKKGTGGGSSTKPKSGCVVIISDGKGTNRAADQRELCLASGQDKFEMQDLRTIDWHDRISSVSVPSGITLSLWDNANWKGKQTVDIVGPVTNKDLGEVQYKNGQGGNIKNEASTLHFWKSGTSGGSSSGSSNTKAVRLYRDINYGGKEVGFNETSVKDASKYGVNDVISSLKVRGGYVFKGYPDKNFKGTPKEWKSDTKWIGTTWNDKISSFKIVKK